MTKCCSKSGGSSYPYLVMAAAVKTAVAPHYNMVGSGKGWKETILLLDEHAIKLCILLENEVKLCIVRETQVDRILH
jgi:hypothetical protein